MGLRVLGAQIDVVPGKPEQNAETILKFIEKYGSDFDIMVFPEMAVPGYLIGDMWERRGFLERCEKALDRIRQATQSLVVIVGSVGVDRSSKGEDGRVRLFNAAFVLQDNNIIPASHLGLLFWPKTLLANYREFDDSRHFFDLRKLAQEQDHKIEHCLKPTRLKIQPKGASELLQVSIGLTICEDAWSDDYYVNPMKILAHQIKASSREGHLGLLVNLSASPFTKGKTRKRQRMLCTRAKECALPILYVNTLGTQNTGKNVFVFDGNSSLTECQADGKWKITSAPQFQESILAFQLRSMDSNKQENCVLIPELSESYHSEIIVNPDALRTVERSIFGEPIHITAAAILFGLKKTLQQWGIQRVAVGVSGGIDSAVVATLMCACLGRDSVTLVNMPSRFNSGLTRSAAAELARNLRCAYHVFGIEKGLAETEKLIFSQPPFSALLSQHVRENMQARDRGGRLLAAISAALGGVFTCNANKSEITVGYSTLYGDAAGFLAPIGDLWKSEVYALAEYLNGERLPGDKTPQLFTTPVIPDASILVTPSAELSAEQNVDLNLGDPLHYPYHDRLFRLWVEEWTRFDLDSTLEDYSSGRLAEKLDFEPAALTELFPSMEEFKTDAQRWWSLYTGMAAFKRVQLPPILTVSKRAFGSDHRESVGQGL